eukprot:CAMPEP_0172885242 /NCGR_PEP_ID=MMETSP1075-20121228/127482_1 /TAXON_ID=2916 /ORGANISM="Ceratium fusus, Strain PA161109" /LENGTH=39 /DNA_ID= /DNA_START= /DNA_END= /DNA_ORIENTATION=
MPPARPRCMQGIASHVSSSMLKRSAVLSDSPSSASPPQM